MKRRLRRYRSMRNFRKTPEPRGERVSGTGHSFVVQKHAARNLHYDFRLELDGVLLSWAVPKGPSLRVADKRLAMRTEDHPLEYAKFEGVIPKGEYGGGTVIVWDRGTWTPIGDPKEGVKKGSLTFTLDGEKLSGRWHLVRTKRGGKEAWLLFKGRDEAANEDTSIIEQAPNSVVSGKSIEAVAAKPTRTWHSNRSAPDAVAPIIDLVKRLPTAVKLTNLEKVLYPEQGLTKAALIAYYAAAADRMLPLVAHRPLALLRCPDGRAKCFFQKHADVGTPKVVGRHAEYVSVADRDGLIALAQMGVLEVHVWGCHDDAIEKPDMLVLDLDPDPAVSSEQLAVGAFRVRDLLDDLGLVSFVKTTGGKGLHVCAPVRRRIDWETFKAFSKAVAQRMMDTWPLEYVVNMAKRERRGKIFIDYLRNGRGATAVAAYSTRAREGATVSAPITWNELQNGVRPSAFTVTTMPLRMKSDPWKGILDVDQAITKAMLAKVGMR